MKYGVLDVTSGARKPPHGRQWRLKPIAAPTSAIRILRTGSPPQRDRDALADSSMCSLKIPGGTFASWRSRIPREASHERHRVSPFTSGSRII